MTQLDDGTPVHAGGREAFDCMFRLVSELNEIDDEAELEAALQAYLHVRKKYQSHYGEFDKSLEVAPQKLNGFSPSYSGPTCLPRD